MVVGKGLVKQRGPVLRRRAPSPLPIPMSIGRSSVRFRCVLGHLVSRGLSISSSLSGLAGWGGNFIASAAAVSASSSAHAAVTSAIAQVAVTAVAIASGACLSTKVDFLWPRGEQLPDSLVVDGVDVTGYHIFKEEVVQKAIAFAKKAHLGQFRKTGEPYVTHCIHTGKILAALVPLTGDRAINTVVAGILHDVIDDTVENLGTIEKEFGRDVALLVSNVSKLSYVNQLLRRHRSKTFSDKGLSPEEANRLRGMLLGMVDDPRVVLIKLADRLHNMRTIYALSMPKAYAVAQETLAIWCSLASRLGVWALKSELEDLCFAVLQPSTFQNLRAELASMWHPNNGNRSGRKLSTHSMFLRPMHEISTTDPEFPLVTNEEQGNMKDLLRSVLPFDMVLDKRKRSVFIDDIKNGTEVPDPEQKIVSDAGIALASLAVCEEALERELLISTSYIPGMEVTLSSRLKSLYSIYCKMKRKKVEVWEVYDARALRVVVGDKSGTLHGPAVKSCYSLLDIVHRLWTPIDGEFDDYIVNPKISGYQSLHTAVQGPDGAALEVQIRTQRMHEHAEFGLAAHWLYQESKVELSKTSPNPTDSPAYHEKYLEDENHIQGDVQRKYGSLEVGHPVLRINGCQLLGAVVIRLDKEGKELLVAVSFCVEASEAVAERRSSFHQNHWESYARLYKKVSDQWWFAPGHGDWCTLLEKYTLCRDGLFHKEDQFGRLLPTFIQIIELTEQEEANYWVVMSDVFEGKPILPNRSEPTNPQASTSAPLRRGSTEDAISSKVKLLRRMLQWEQVRDEASGTTTKPGGGNLVSSTINSHNPYAVGEIVIIVWPHGEIMRMRSGSTAADAAARVGHAGKLMLVNGLLAQPQTELKDGDIVEPDFKVGLRQLAEPPLWLVLGHPCSGDGR